MQKREARRKRRQRNQILAYLVVILFIILLAVGILALIQLITNSSEDPGNSVPDSQSYSSQVEDLPTEPEDTNPVESEEPSSEYEPPVVELTQEQKLDQIVNAAIEVMPLEDKVAGLFMVTPELLTGVANVTKAGDTTKTALGKYAVGGILYTNKNIKTKSGFMGMLDNTVLYSKYPIFLAVEEEGGKATQLMKAKLGTETDDAKTIGASGDTQNAYQTGVTIGTYMGELGLNMNFAPVADLAKIQDSVMADRSFGSDPNVVVDYVLKMMEGMQAQGIVPCVKHFPGMGSVTADTENGPVVSELSEADFQAGELALFQKLVDVKVPVIIVSNVAVPSLTGDNTPCSLAPSVVTDILRKQMGYDGLVITDSLNEKAVSDYYAADEAAIMALKAGCDMVVCPEDFELAYQGVLKAVQDGTISQERVDDALRRIYRIKFADRVE